MHRPQFHHRVLLVVILACFSLPAYAEVMDDYTIGRHGQANIQYPSWFKKSFFELTEDLADARDAGKRGILLFFSQKACNHCQAFISTTLADPLIRKRVQANYDVIVMDIFSDLEVVRVDGSSTTIREFAEETRARLTPTTIFFGTEGRALARVVGFYPPEKFRHALDYIDSESFRTTKLSKYLYSKMVATGNMGSTLKVDHSIFARPPHMLDRSRIAGQRPIMVIFDAPNCNPCARFHRRVLASKDMRNAMADFDAVHLNRYDDESRIITPDGTRTTPRKWAQALQLSYDIAVVFFDKNGKEVHRLDAETGHDRMLGSMQYVQEKAYKRHQQFLRWRREQARTNAGQDQAVPRE